uniref:Uncharacterized protein n=1 Tax=Timema poppense TaxID=170557 RepID=A0A7R9CRQ9_TIMPO|nr:unnamed protein product [Timema poppensis]
MSGHRLLGDLDTSYDIQMPNARTTAIKSMVAVEGCLQLVAHSNDTVTVTSLRFLLGSFGQEQTMPGCDVILTNIRPLFKCSEGDAHRDNIFLHLDDRGFFFDKFMKKGIHNIFTIIDNRRPTLDDINSILNDDENIIEAKVFISPPEHHSLSDEDREDEYFINPEINHFSDNQFSATAEFPTKHLGETGIVSTIMGEEDTPE